MTKARVTTVLLLLVLAAAARSVAGQPTEARPLYRLALPFRTWALDLDLTAFNLPEGAPATNSGKGRKERPVRPVETLSEDGESYQLFAFHKSPEESNVSSHLGIMVRMMPARADIGAGAEALRDFQLKKLDRDPLRVNSRKTSEYKQIPLARYSIQLSNDFANNLGGPSVIPTFKMRTIVAYFVKDGVWVTVGLMDLDITERDEKFFYTLLDSIKFADTSAPSTSFDYYHKGRLLFLLKDYGRATPVLASALDLERRERKLDPASWRDMISILIDSYASSGDFARAKEIMDYAATSDPTNPRFQMALARYNAGFGDLDQVIEHLEKAFQLNAASGQNGLLLDPMRDRAFERYWKDEKFRKAVKAMLKNQG